MSTIDRSACRAPRHGTVSAYRQGCRCADTREADRVYRKRLREGRGVPRLVDSTGTIRRLRALAAIGWPSTELGEHLGCSRIIVQNWRRGRFDRVQRRTADRVSAVYERLSGTPGPATGTRTYAAAQGWAPPLLWEDVDIDDPAAKPVDDAPQVDNRRRVHRDDLEHLRGYGLPVEVIAARLAVQPSSIERHLERDRERQNREAA